MAAVARAAGDARSPRPWRSARRRSGAVLDGAARAVDGAARAAGAGRAGSGPSVLPGMPGSVRVDGRALIGPALLQSRERVLVLPLRRPNTPPRYRHCLAGHNPASPRRPVASTRVLMSERGLDADSFLTELDGRLRAIQAELRPGVAVPTLSVRAMERRAAGGAAAWPNGSAVGAARAGAPGAGGGDHAGSGAASGRPSCWPRSRR